jgi:endonuclease/exonuclease/phosphatase family metal-dependent hydrolase
MSGLFSRRCPGLAALALVLMASVLAGSMARGASADLRVMSFNIRVGTAQDGENHWEKRKDLVVRTIRRFDPDLLGLQESQRFQGEYLLSKLPGYDMLGVGNRGGAEGSYSAILYKAKRFEKLREGHFWLSETPDVPGSRSWDSKFPRVTSWVELRDRRSRGPSFIYMNTHWDHVGAEARFRAATLMRRKIAELAPDKPVLLTGDFNADQGGRAYRRMMGLDDADTGRRLVDTYRKLHPGDSGTVGTAHGFRGKPGDGRIDWILHDDRFVTLEAAIDRTSYEKRFPSDHFPVTAVIRPATTPATAPATSTGGGR